MPNFKQVIGQCQLQSSILEKDTSAGRVIFKLLTYLRCHSSLMLDLLAEPRCLLCDAVGVEAVDLVLYGQGFCLLVFVSYNHRIRTVNLENSTINCDSEQC